MARPVTPLRERLLRHIVMPGPMTPCATWVGAYKVDGRRWRTVRGARPVIRLGSSAQSPIVYVAPLLLRLAHATYTEGMEACHTCPTGTPSDGRYRCVDLAHLRWGTRADNERDKRRS